MAKCKKLAPSISDVVKIIDVDSECVSNKTIEFLSDAFTTYRDQVLKEDLIDIGNAVDELAEHKLSSDVKREIRSLGKLASKHDAAYVRFINH